MGIVMKLIVGAGMLTIVIFLALAIFRPATLDIDSFKADITQQKP